MDPLSILKLVLGTYRGAFLTFLFSAVWFDLLKISDQTTTIAGTSVTIGRPQVLLIIGVGLVATLVHTFVRFLRKADFCTFVGAGFGTPSVMAWSFEKSTLSDLIRRFETCSDWKKMNINVDADLAKNSIDKLDDLLEAAGLPRYFHEPSGLNDNIAETHTTFILKTTRSPTTAGAHARVEGFGYVTNERTHPGNSCLLLRVVPESPMNIFSLKPRFAQCRIITFSCREYYQPFDPEKHFRIYISLECRFSFRKLRWFVRAGVMSLETRDNVWKRVPIGFSNDHF